MLNSIVFQSCFETFFTCTLNASKATSGHFYLSGWLHTVYIGKPSERMSNFCTVRFQKPNPNRISVFRTSLVHTSFHPIDLVSTGTCNYPGGPRWWIRVPECLKC